MAWGLLRPRLQNAHQLTANRHKPDFLLLSGRSPASSMTISFLRPQARLPSASL